MSVNLAANPFENRRPVHRVQWLLLTLGLVVWGLAAVKYWDYAAGSSEETRARLQAVEAEIDDLNNSLRAAEGSLSEADLEQRNERIVFLNAKLGERAFPWSRLFQDLSRVQPFHVRLHRVTPQIEDDEESGLPGYASLALDGSALSREAWYRFVDRLFKHPRFESPRMISESQDEGEVSFRLNVLYRISLDEVPADETAEAGAAAEDMGEEADASAAR